MTDLLIDLYKFEFEKYNWKNLKKIPINLRVVFICLLCNVIFLFTSTVLYADKVILNTILIFLLFVIMATLHCMIRYYDKMHVFDYIENYKIKIKKFRTILKDKWDISTIEQLEKLSNKLSDELPRYLYISNFFQPLIKFVSAILIPICVYAYSIVVKEKYVGQEIMLIFAIILIIIYITSITMMLKPVATSVIESKHRVLLRVINLIDDIIILDDGSHDSIR